MTPQEYLDAIQRLLDQKHTAGILEFYRKHDASVKPQMTDVERGRLSGTIEYAVMVEKWCKKAITD
jgi:hypothetical protein